MPERVLFARIGWMHQYQGITPEDDRIIGGGKFNRDNIGEEAFNFLPWAGKLFGFVQPPGKSARINLERIDAAADGNRLDDVLVVFVAARPGGRQVVVGWYHEATVLRNAAFGRPKSAGRERMFNIEAPRDLAVLIPDDYRRHEIPSGVDAIGQSNVFYPLDPDGTPRRHVWMQQAVRYVRQYETGAPNLLRDPAANVIRSLADQVDAVRAAAEGQGFAGSPEQRRAIEQHAVRRARKHFAKTWTSIESCEKTHSYDLRCTSAGRELKVEVKGTTGRGASVILTKNEVELGRKENVALFLLHSIVLKDGKPTGGVARVIDDWGKTQVKLTPLAYICRLL